ncbi:Phospholipid phosphatase-related protein type 1 [Varanus komodoensis]|nr:Phospholipid phosphatase-related protein type 1 [Varanus komodoensis]
MALGNNTQRSYSIIPCFIFVELVIMAGTVLLAYYFECTDTFQVHIQGFFCQDGDLMKPYPGTEDESFISPLVLYCVLAATPTAIYGSIPHAEKPSQVQESLSQGAKDEEM